MSAPPPPKRPGRNSIQVVQALYDYEKRNPDELSFKEGNILYVLNKDDPNWWKCRANNVEGLVPANYVEEATSVMDNPLHEAAKRGNISFLKELIRTGISVNGLDKALNSPIHWAARNGHVDCIVELLNANPVLNQQNKLGDTPLHCAAWGGHAEIAKLLLEHGVDPSIKNKDGSTALDLAKNDETAAAIMEFQGAFVEENYEGVDTDEEDDE
ncbi:osteoclast stimulating factor 1 [Neocallimastix lanati (nom. inval.)]|jgi:ankyrin repeat protein|uniref:Osteoclast-stimulating factor 1 n=1 Tax=Neocallimastix californiae TaxID=1754190 RepID=A0A1Y2D7Y6_9FUNG|nr:osteoclast stimulating factor 1 [Neocallimastix sp. JGI-2020a]ORY55373.1 osteoclast stimulating factor 1 [Neocallimastix californiae]|eukprot:ORY55373.1 osteoclast stimulating factor 1 [Neocallimastix californiae]